MRPLQKARLEAVLLDIGDYTQPTLLRDNAGRTQALGAAFGIESYLLSLSQRFVPAGLNCRMMDEYVITTAGRGNKAESLTIVKPLHSTCSHFAYLMNE